MLIDIDDSVVAFALASQQNLITTKAALENLTFAHRKGFHVVTGKPATFRNLANRVASLGSETKATLRRLELESTVTRALCGSFSWYVSAISPSANIPVQQSSGARPSQVPITNFQKFELCMKTILLGENLADSDLYELFGKGMLHNQGLSRFRIHADKQSGGGHTTAQVLATIETGRERLCLCIVDSDRDHPNAYLGTTAAAVAQVHTQSPQQLTRLVITTCRELENELPLMVVQNAYRSDVLKQRACELLRRIQSIDPEVHQFLDLKSGLSGMDFIPASQHGNQSQRYWDSKLPIVLGVSSGYKDQNCHSSRVCSSPSQCACIFISPLGKQVLNDCFKSLKDLSSASLDRSLRSSLGYLSHGRQVMEACLGSNGVLV